jgi:hypothetical protein
MIVVVSQGRRRTTPCSRPLHLQYIILRPMDETLAGASPRIVHAELKLASCISCSQLNNPTLSTSYQRIGYSSRCAYLPLHSHLCVSEAACARHIQNRCISQATAGCLEDEAWQQTKTASSHAFLASPKTNGKVTTSDPETNNDQVPARSPLKLFAGFWRGYLLELFVFF